MATQFPTAVEGWTGHDTLLLVVAAIGIALIVVLIAKFKLHPFLALVLGSAFVGLASGVELAKITTNFEDGAVLLAILTFGYAVGFTGNQITSKIGASLGPIAGILLIVGAGGGFKQTLIGAGVGDSVKKWAEGTNMSVLLLGFMVAVALRLATGSATVATVTAAGIVAPLASSLTPTHAALPALALGAGSLFLSHVNDAGFWLVKELFGLTVGQTFKTWSVMETLISVVGFGLVMLLSVLI
jgi:GntP family gluconate:H+ symporter